MTWVKSWTLPVVADRRQLDTHVRASWRWSARNARVSPSDRRGWKRPFHPVKEGTCWSTHSRARTNICLCSVSGFWWTSTGWTRCCAMTHAMEPHEVSRAGLAIRHDGDWHYTMIGTEMCGGFINLKKAKANRQKNVRESRKMSFWPQGVLVNEGLIVRVPACLTNETNIIGWNKYVQLCCGRDLLCDLWA